MPKKIVILTGAGISAESGIKTFRDPDGLWEGHRPEEVATPEAFRRDPEMVYRFYNARRNRLQSGRIEPNPAHLALVRLEQAIGDSFLLVTQNVDNLHERAGTKRIIHMHGELMKKRCQYCSTISTYDRDLTTEDQCSSCGETGGMRPHIVWFGEMPFELDRIWSEVADCEVFAAIGTSGVVEPAASLVHEARRTGADTFCFSLDSPENRGAFDNFIEGKAGETVPPWVDQFIASAS